MAGAERVRGQSGAWRVALRPGVTPRGVGAECGSQEAGCFLSLGVGLLS